MVLAYIRFVCGFFPLNHTIEIPWLMGSVVGVVCGRPFLSEQVGRANPMGQDGSSDFLDPCHKEFSAEKIFAFISRYQGPVEVFLILLYGCKDFLFDISL